MYRNTTNVNETADCYYIGDDQTLYAQFNDGEILETYKLVSDTYYKTDSRNPQTYGEQQHSYQCLTIQDVRQIQSKWDFVAPIYHEMAILSVLFIIWLAYRLILYPFFRKRV